MRKLTTKEFITNFKEKYPDMLGLDLTNFEYNTAHKKIIAICCKHNTVVNVTPSNLMKGSKGCKKCKSEFISKKNGYSIDEFISKSRITHGNKYNYDNVVWKGSKVNVEIDCDLHGSFIQLPQNHYNGYGCPQCGYANLRKSVTEFIKESNDIHKNQYTYENVNYVNNYTPVTVTCKEHGNFEIIPTAHTIHQRGCPVCYPRNASWVETAWLNSLNVPADSRQQRVTINSKSYIVDARIENTIYEFWGDFWHGNPKTFLAEDRNTRCGKTFGELYNKTQQKRQEILDAGYNLIEIWESDFKVEKIHWKK